MKTKMSRLLHRFACCNERGGAAVTAAIPSTMSTHGENANARGCRKRFVCFGIGRSHSLTTLQVPVSQGSFNKRRTRAPSNSSGNPLHALEEKLQRVTASSEAWRREYELRCQIETSMRKSARRWKHAWAKEVGEHQHTREQLFFIRQVLKRYKNELQSMIRYTLSNRANNSRHRGERGHLNIPSGPSRNDRLQRKFIPHMARSSESKPSSGLENLGSLVHELHSVEDQESDPVDLDEEFPCFHDLVSSFRRILRSSPKTQGHDADAVRGSFAEEIASSPTTTSLGPIGGTSGERRPVEIKHNEGQVDVWPRGKAPTEADTLHDTASGRPPLHPFRPIPRLCKTEPPRPREGRRSKVARSQQALEELQGKHVLERIAGSEAVEQESGTENSPARRCHNPQVLVGTPRNVPGSSLSPCDAPDFYLPVGVEAAADHKRQQQQHHPHSCHPESEARSPPCLFQTPDRSLLSLSAGEESLGGMGEAFANPSCTMCLECTGFVTDTVGASVDGCGNCASGYGADVQASGEFCTTGATPEADSAAGETRAAEQPQS